MTDHDSFCLGRGGGCHESLAPGPGAAQMTVVHLVRHGRPLVDRGIPPAQWTLDRSASANLTALRQSGVLPRSGHWTCSPEPKALATASALTDEPVTVDDDLREAFRPAEFVREEEFDRRVTQSLTDLELPATEGWERGTATAARVRAAFDRALLRADGIEVVLVGHGTSLSLLVADLLDRPPDISVWRRMQMPDHCAIDVDVRRLLSDWGAWTAALD